ncbi:hypothetical protein TYRP_005643 [Tyrophagus putrescentiae]|nr:hypothetical protein TYRP_005643 [Tyrophagus putrescentiae]
MARLSKSAKPSSTMVGMISTESLHLETHRRRARLLAVVVEGQLAEPHPAVVLDVLRNDRLHLPPVALVDVRILRYDVIQHALTAETAAQRVACLIFLAFLLTLLSTLLAPLVAALSQRLRLPPRRLVHVSAPAHVLSAYLGTLVDEAVTSFGICLNLSRREGCCVSSRKRDQLWVRVAHLQCATLSPATLSGHKSLYSANHLSSCQNKKMMLYAAVFPLFSLTALPLSTNNNQLTTELSGCMTTPRSQRQRRLLSPAVRQRVIRLHGGQLLMIFIVAADGPKATCKGGQGKAKASPDHGRHRRPPVLLFHFPFFISCWIVPFHRSFRPPPHVDAPGDVDATEEGGGGGAVTGHRQRCYR